MKSEIFELKINRQQINDLIDRRLLIGGLLNTLFTPTSEGAKKLETALIGYHWFDGGSPDYKHLTIKNSIIDLQTLKGLIEFEYLLQKTFGCADIQTQEIEKQQWTFEINTSSLSILFIGPTPALRIDEI